MPHAFRRTPHFHTCTLPRILDGFSLDEGKGLWPEVEGSSHRNSWLRVQVFVIETGRQFAEVARDSEVNERTIRNWTNPWKADSPESEKALSAAELARVDEMEDEIRKLRMRNEFPRNDSFEVGFDS